jgi:hypothetical protein
MAIGLEAARREGYLCSGFGVPRAHRLHPGDSPHPDPNPSTIRTRRTDGMRNFLLALSIIAIAHGIAAAQPVPIVAGGFAAPSDSVAAPPKRRLQPENLSLLETMLWDEHGFFRSTGLASPLTQQSRKSELGLRRFMLASHQIGGFTTEALMLAAAFTGQKILDGDYRYQPWHQALTTATIFSYSGTALLSLLTPPPYIRRESEMSTIWWHKLFAWIHIGGMVATPLLAGAINRRKAYGSTARIHQVAGYITLTAFTAALVVVTF